jgi:hypothetical protein
VRRSILLGPSNTSTRRIWWSEKAHEIRRTSPGKEQKQGVLQLSLEIFVAGCVVTPASLNPLHASVSVGRLVRDVLVQACVHPGLTRVL